jgi:hypothetical protein
MKDLSNVEIKPGDIVYYLAEKSRDLEFGEVLEVSETSIVVKQLRLNEDAEGKQSLTRLTVEPETSDSQMIFILPGGSERLPIVDLAETATV